LQIGSHGAAAASGHSPGSQNQAAAEAHESPPVMTVPLVILAVLALFFGFVGSPVFNGAFQQFVAGAGNYGSIDLPLAAASTLVGLLGILVAWGYYGAHWFSAAATARTIRPIYLLLVNKYYLDDLYNWLVGRVLMGLSDALAWFDRHVVDGAVNGAAWLAYSLVGWVLTRAESGRLPNYALVFFVGVILLAGAIVGTQLGH
jgi:NADH-quinone oxidoreductase subunit L